MVMIMIMMATAIVKMLIALTSQPLERFIFLKKSGGGGLRFEENQKRLTALKFLRY